MQKQLSEYIKYDTLSAELQGEVKTLFPKIKSFAVTQAKQVNIETNKAEKITFALISLKNNQKISNEERNHLTEWLKARTKTQNMRLVIQ